ncbi:ATP-grasp domain-containing protein [Actinoplanes sp. N902-109]|uniref:ATP-grasp domain-containing protein n=1 Tax=Actinoplanes sp. (strain N902-109) TaxID=649831 RepID=UPI00032935C1|nr:ATP-grasp domain-containing protein [Actinoplanes sp. N902-109]AGL19000.1 carboxylase [Actinoplanes sp. N902-109]
MTGPVLLLDPGGNDGAALCADTTAAGYVPLPVRHAPGVTRLEAAAGGFRIDLAGPVTVDLLTELATARGVGAVLTTREFLVGVAAELAARLGLPGNRPELAGCLRSKVAMADRFRVAGVRAPRTLVAADPAGLRQLLARGGIALPVVVKPAGRAGSQGVSVVTDDEQIDAAYARIAALGPPPYGLPVDNRTIVQPYLRGPEVSVESVTRDGRTERVCVTEKTVTAGTSRIEIGHLLPVPLPTAVERDLTVQVGAALTAVGIRNAVSHCEAIVDDSGRAWIIEAAARPGAARLSRLVELALGTSLDTLAVRIAAGDPPGAWRAAAPRTAALRFFRAPRPGVVAGIAGLPALTDEVPLVEVIRGAGSRIAGVTDNTARLGRFAVVGASPAEVRRRADDLLARVSVRMEDA